jgi:phenylacetaldehyde dehydrogenase
MTNPTTKEDTTVTIAIRKPTLGSAATAFLAKEHLMLIDGKWVPARSGETFAVEDPATQETIGRVPAGDKADIDAAVAAARRAFDSGPWSRMLPRDRSRLVWKLGDLLEQHADEFAQLEALDNGKPVTNARNDDVASSIDMFHYMAGWSTRLNGETIPVSKEGHWHAYTLREPVGVVGQIIPWNFPLMMAAWKLAPALAAGCTIVLKPAEQTPLSALRFGELIQEAGFPDGVVNIVTGFGETAGAALSEHPDVDKVAFTGSTEVGKLIVKAAAGNLKRVSLELGGKSPAIVFPNADLDDAVAGTASAIFYNQGQCCTAGSRLFAHKSIYDRVVQGVADAAGKVRVGHGLDPAVNLGPLVSKEQHDRVTGFIEAGRAGQDQPRHAGGARGDLRAGGLRPVLRRRRPGSGGEVRQRHRVRPPGEHLDAEPQGGTRARAEDPGRHDLHQQPQFRRPCVALRRFQAVGVGPRDGQGRDGALHRDQVGRRASPLAAIIFPVRFRGRSGQRCGPFLFE